MSIRLDLPIAYWYSYDNMDHRAGIRIRAEGRLTLYVVQGDPKLIDTANTSPICTIRAAVGQYGWR